MPRGISSTPGCVRVVGSVPLIVARKVPGSDGVPRARNQPAPLRAIRASWASVSAFSTRLGRPSTPRRKTGTRGSEGTPGRPSSRFTSADSCPATNPPGSTRTSTRVPRAARCTGSAGMRGPRASTILFAPSAAPTRDRPSTTRPGERASSSASLPLSGSPSIALPTMTGRCPATEASLRAVGKPPPPRPVSPASSTRRIRPGASRCGSGYSGAGPSSRSVLVSTVVIGPPPSRCATGRVRRTTGGGATSPHLPPQPCTALRRHPSTACRRRCRRRGCAAATPARGRR